MLILLISPSHHFTSVVELTIIRENSSISIPCDSHKNHLTDQIFISQSSLF